MGKFKKFFAILGVATLSTAFSLPVLANKRVPKTIGNILSTAKPVIKAEQKLENACNFEPSLGKEPKLLSADSLYKSLTEEWNQVQRTCAGAVVSKCIYNAVETDINNPDKIKNNPVPYINKTVSCVDKTSTEILRRRDQINKKILKATSDAAKISAEKAEKASNETSKIIEKSATGVADSFKRTGKNIKNVFNKKKKKR
tara:strand:+ start:256 stop:855 length:600 start_codon:yes stop_codon:yes gene_type:complete